MEAVAVSREESDKVLLAECGSLEHCHHVLLEGDLGTSTWRKRGYEERGYRVRKKGEEGNVMRGEEKEGTFSPSLMTEASRVVRARLSGCHAGGSAAAPEGKLLCKN